MKLKGQREIGALHWQSGTCGPRPDIPWLLSHRIMQVCPRGAMPE